MIRLNVLFAETLSYWTVGTKNIYENVKLLVVKGQQMSTLIILQGLPASGKTTKARELSQPGNNVRVNRDLLREMLHFGFSLKEEDTIRKTEELLIKAFLNKGRDVIVDDTNLKDKTIRRLFKMAAECSAEVEFIEMNVSLEECIRRDAVRDNPVGRGIIRHMYNDFQLRKE